MNKAIPECIVARNLLNRVEDKLRNTHSKERMKMKKSQMKSYHSWSVRRYFVLRVWDEEKCEGPMHAALETNSKNTDVNRFDFLKEK